MRMLFVSFGSLMGMLALQGCSTPVPLSVMNNMTWAQYIHTASLPSLLLRGEQHDAPEHQQWQRATAQALITRQQLVAVVLEMADQGYSTRGLTRSQPNKIESTRSRQHLDWYLF